MDSSNYVCERLANSVSLSASRSLIARLDQTPHIAPRAASPTVASLSKESSDSRPLTTCSRFFGDAQIPCADPLDCPRLQRLLEEQRYVERRFSCQEHGNRGGVSAVEDRHVALSGDSRHLDGAVQEENVGVRGRRRALGALRAGA